MFGAVPDPDNNCWFSTSTICRYNSVPQKDWNAGQSAIISQLKPLFAASFTASAVSALVLNITSGLVPPSATGPAAPVVDTWRMNVTLGASIA